MQHDLSSVSRTSVGLINSREDQQTFRRPVGLTITVEKIDRVLTDIQAQIEHLWQHRINLELVRAQLADMEAQWRDE
jgi:hypothetical protein